MTGTAMSRASGGALSNASNYNPFAIAGAGATTSSLFVKYNGQTGKFSYGQNDEELEHGSEYATDIMNSQWEWSFWDEGSVIETLKARIWDDPQGYNTEPDTLPASYKGDFSLEEIRNLQATDRDFRGGWGVQAVVKMRAMEGDGEYTLKLNKGVAMNSFLGLLDQFGKMFQLREGLTPIVTLDVNKFKSKKAGVGWRYAPDLKITDWVSEEDISAAGGNNPDDYDTGGADVNEESDPEPQPEAEKPKARGRRGKF
jgi:hypothetical protein